MFDDLLDLKKQPRKIHALDFDKFIEEVKKMPFEQGQDVLWRAVFNLERWHFITKPYGDINQAKPFLGRIDEKGWLFLFTDGQHAHEFGERQGLLNKEGAASTIAMTPEAAVEWTEEWEKAGVYGVRFNEGKHGWYAPIKNLRPRMEYLKNDLMS